VTPRLFVYGTLAPGRPNEHVLAVLGGTWQPACVTGTLWEHGWGAAQGYPGIVIDEQGTDRVDGLLFTAEALDQHWARLDEFEGEGYRREVTRATLADGRVVDTYIYVLAETPAP
jgi:gamma-glutamylcyclotransferase (GGCT)/AIG2-like uncharacterized protein YtfP